MEYKLMNISIEQKPPRGRYEDKDVHAKSSDILVYNLYDQTKEAIEANGLSSLWARLDRRK